MMVSYTKRNAGFSLMEVLISVLVLSIGLLGLAGLQVAGVRSGHSVYYRTQATLLANDIMDRMRTNPVRAREGGYDTADLDDVSDHEPADDAPQEELDLFAWESSLREVFDPLTYDGSIACTGDGVCRVTVQWDDSRPELTLSDDEGEGEGGGADAAAAAQADAEPEPENLSRKEASSRRRFTMRTRL